MFGAEQRSQLKARPDNESRFVNRKDREDRDSTRQLRPE